MTRSEYAQSLATFPAGTIAVTLTDLEIEIAAGVARQRNNAAHAARATPMLENLDDAYEANLIGCLGEMATAKGLDRYWSGAGTTYRDDSDLGIVQVRATKNPNGELVLRARDLAKPTIAAPWVLAVQLDPHHHVLVGWIIGSDGPGVGYYAAKYNNPAAHYVPQRRLRPFPITVDLDRTARA